jgi:hypothetical protein
MSTLTDSISRRTALAGLGAGGLGLAAAATTRSVSAQDAAADMANHPMVGVWLGGRAPDELGPIIFAEDGTVTNSGPTVSMGPDGAIAFSTPALGVWEPASERGIHFTFIVSNFDATGASTGTLTVDGYPVASADGMSFYDEATQAVVTIRDATGAIALQLMGSKGEVPPIGGVRILPGKPGFDEMLPTFGTPEAGTPTS